MAQQPNIPQQAAVSYTIHPSQSYPHVYWIDLYNDGTLHECVVLKKDAAGNLFFFPINHCDDIDKRRLASLLMDRNARNVELWDVAANRTLGNGVNALVYFHQLAKVLTPNGKIMDPRSGQTGNAVAGTVKTAPTAIATPTTPADTPVTPQQ